MIYLEFIKLRWKEATRSNIWQRNVAANIGIGFLMLLLMSYLLMLGLFLDPILQKMFPDRDPASVFNSIMVYYFLFDLLVRYVMQGLPTFSVESYLHLPIKRSSVVHFILMRTGLHLLNFLPLLVFIPFALTSLARTYDGFHALIWILSAVCLIFMNGFLSTWLKRQLVFRARITAIAALAVVQVAVMDHFGYVRLTVFSEKIFNTLASTPWTLVFPVLLLITAYYIQYRFLLSRMYPEEVVRRKYYIASDLPRIKYLESMGLTGDLMMLEMKLWWRHKRTKSMLYMLPLFVLYGFFFYPQPVYRHANGFLIFVGIFMSGGLMLNYLNYAFGYESNYFDGILTRRIDMTTYIRAKLTIAMLITTFCFIVTVPYVFFGPDILLINFVTYLFNIGVLSFLLMYMATFNKLKMDLSKGSAFNYQGIGAMNWLVLFPAFLLPVLIYAPFSLMGYKYMGLAMIGLLGIIGFLFRKNWLKKISGNFFKRKYIMADGFRGD